MFSYLPHIWIKENCQIYWYFVLSYSSDTHLDLQSRYLPVAIISLSCKYEKKHNKVQSWSNFVVS